MALVRPVVYDGGQQRRLHIGDVFCRGEAVPATNNGTAVTLTGALLLPGIYLGNPGGAATYTLDTAANIVAALQAANNGPIQNGTTFRFLIILTTAQTGTVAATANTGVTVNRGSIASNDTKEFLVTINNATPVQTFQCNTTNASAVVSGLSQTQCSQLSIGMIVTNVVNGLQGQTITAIDPNAGTVTLSGNANATSTTPVAITFSPVITVDGLKA